MSKKAANYGIAVSVIGILIVAFIGGFYFSGERITGAQTAEVHSEQLPIYDNLRDTDYTNLPTYLKGNAGDDIVFLDKIGLTPTSNALYIDRNGGGIVLGQGDMFPAYNERAQFIGYFNGNNNQLTGRDQIVSSAVKSDVTITHQRREGGTEWTQIASVQPSAQQVAAGGATGQGQAGAPSTEEQPPEDEEPPEGFYYTGSQLFESPTCPNCGYYKNSDGRWYSYDPATKTSTPLNQIQTTSVVQSINQKNLEDLPSVPSQLLSLPEIPQPQLSLPEIPQPQPADTTPISKREDIVDGQEYYLGKDGKLYRTLSTDVEQQRRLNPTEARSYYDTEAELEAQAREVEAETERQLSYPSLFKSIPADIKRQLPDNKDTAGEFNLDTPITLKNGATLEISSTGWDYTRTEKKDGRDSKKTDISYTISSQQRTETITNYDYDDRGNPTEAHAETITKGADGKETGRTNVDTTYEQKVDADATHAAVGVLFSTTGSLQGNGYVVSTTSGKTTDNKDYAYSATKEDTIYYFSQDGTFISSSTGGASTTTPDSKANQILSTISQQTKYQLTGTRSVFIRGENGKVIEVKRETTTQAITRDADGKVTYGTETITQGIYADMRGAKVVLKDKNGVEITNPTAEQQALLDYAAKIKKSTWDFSTESFWYGLETAAKGGGVFRRMSGLIPNKEWKEFLDDWAEWSNKILCMVMADKDCVTSKVCRWWIGIVKKPGNEGLAMLDIPGEITRAGVFVAGERSEIMHPNQSKEYFYKLVFKIENPTYEDIYFNVHLKGSNPTTVYEQQIRLEKGQTFSKIGAQLLRKYNFNYYDRICVRFFDDKGKDKKIMFAGKTEVNEVCNDITDIGTTAINEYRAVPYIRPMTEEERRQMEEQQIRETGW